jgi:hypothetical protein
LAPPRKSRAKSLVIAGGVVLLLGLLVVGVGGFFAMNWLNSKPDNATTGTASKDKSAAKGTNGSTTERAVAGAEVGRYWLEVLPNTLAAEPERTAGLTPLASGQAFKFHFQFGDNGYLYIVGPGQQSQPTAFLTDQPAAISGLTSNQVTKGGDFSFPSGIEHWLELDKKAGTEEYTIIFSPERLSEPTFFTAAATGNPLSETQQSELRDFLAKYKTSEAASEVGEKDSSDPFVKVKMPQTTCAGANVPVLFLVRIQHK